MIKKSFLTVLGCVIFMVGVILFPLPVPLGLPTMIIGLVILFKASDRMKRKIIRSANKNRYTRKVWLKLRSHLRAYKVSN